MLHSTCIVRPCTQVPYTQRFTMITGYGWREATWLFSSDAHELFSHVEAAGRGVLALLRALSVGGDKSDARRRVKAHRLTNWRGRLDELSDIW